jgi:polysaccharide biosynthesis transport protein
MNAPTQQLPIDVEHAPAPQQIVNLREVMRVLIKHRYSIIGLTALIVVLTALRVFSLAPTYRATATLLIEREQARAVNIQDIITSQQGNWEYYATQHELLRSRPIAERVVEKLELGKRIPVTQTQLTWWQQWLPKSMQPKLAKVSPEAHRQSLVEYVRGGAQIVPIRNSQLVRITFDGPDPALVADLANAMGDAYIEASMEGRMEMVQRASTWMNSRISGLKEKVTAAQRRVQDFKDANNIVEVGKSATALEQEELRSATGNLAETRNVVARLQTQYEQAQSLLRNPTTDTSGNFSDDLYSSLRSDFVAAQRKVTEYRQQYGAEFPAMKQAESELRTASDALKRHVQSLVTTLGAELSSARRREARLQSEQSSARQDVQDKSKKSFELGQLMAEAEAHQAVYDMFQSRSKETTAVSDWQTSNARIAETAKPNNTPVAPNKRAAVTVAAFFGLVLAIILAFILEHLDSTLKGAEDVERKLGLPVLGMLPRLKSGGKKDMAPMRSFATNPSSAFAESIRTVRTGVLLSSVDTPHRIVLVTSSVPGEGKSTLSANLAAAFGQIKKTLLIDADMRRPTVARAMEVVQGRAGLSQFMTGDAKISECMTAIEGTNLFVMSAGVIPPNPLEMLSSKKFADALESLSRAFDHIVIDAPPSLAVSDALVLSKLANAVLYVVKADATPHQVAQQGLKRLRRVNAPLIGVVVNRVAPKAESSYGKYSYYGDGYYQGYNYGYSRDN